MMTGGVSSRGGGQHDIESPEHRTRGGVAEDTGGTGTDLCLVVV